MATSGFSALAGILISVLHSFRIIPVRALPRRCPFPSGGYSLYPAA